jgi:hypothetical protein
MASEFQRRKVAGVFQAMGVWNSDGFLDEEGFDALAQRWMDIRGTAPGEPVHDALHTVMTGW